MHATELGAGHHAGRRAQASLRSTQHVSEDRRSRPRIELRLTNGWCDERANGCQGREIVCRSEKMRQIEKRTEYFCQHATLHISRTTLTATLYPSLRAHSTRLNRAISAESKSPACSVASRAGSTPLAHRHRHLPDTTGPPLHRPFDRAPGEHAAHTQPGIVGPLYTGRSNTFYLTRLSRFGACTG